MESVSVGALTDVAAVIPRGSADAVQAKLYLNAPIMAPLEKGQEVGYFALEMDGQGFKNFPIVALEKVAEGSIVSSLWDRAILVFENLFEL